MNLKKAELPAFALFKANTHHSTANWLAYQSAPNEVRVVNFAPDASVREFYILDVPSQPLQSVRLAYDQQANKIYVAITFLTRYMVLEKNKLLTQFAIPLNCNIVQFENGFITSDGVFDGRQVYFVFVTSGGKIITQPVDNIESRATIDIPCNAKISAVCAQDVCAFLGTEKGEVVKADLNTRKVMAKYHTEFEFPIVNMRISKDFLVLGTCHGQIHVLNFSLKPLTLLSAHKGMVNLLHVDQSEVYSVGDEGVLRVWTCRDSSLIEKGAKQYNQKPNLLFSVEKRGYVNFYQSTKYQEIL